MKDATGLNSFVDSLSQSIQKNRALKEQQAQDLIKSGAYASVQGGQQPGFLGRMSGNFFGPQTGGSNMNISGQNYQYQTPELKAQELKNQMQAYSGLLGASPSSGSSSPTERSMTLNPVTGDMKMTFKSPDQFKIEEKQQQFNQREWDKIVKESDGTNSSPRTAFGRANVANFSANRALSTLENPMVTNQEAGNVMADIASIYQGGSPTQFGMSEQGYKTINGQIAGAMQYLTGKPQDAVTPQIKERLQKVLQGMKKTNNAVIKQQIDYIEKAKGKVISSYPDEWKGMKDTMLSDNYNGLDNSKDSVTAMAPKAFTSENDIQKGLNNGSVEPGSIVVLNGKKFMVHAE